jgi:DNA-binding response OmpR family regulator
MMDAMLTIPDYGEHEAELLLALEGLRILVVDDNADARAAIAAVLAECGADVLPVASASAALDVLPRARPDVMVSDIAMPGMDGRSLIRTLLAGYQLYLAKPFDPTELVGLIARLVGRGIF